MNFIIDILVELFLGFFGEGFISLCSVFIPKKIRSEKRRRIIGVVCLIISLVLFIGLFVGVVLLTETGGKSIWGWLLIALSVIYTISGVIFKFVSHLK